MSSAPVIANQYSSLTTNPESRLCLLKMIELPHDVLEYLTGVIDSPYYYDIRSFLHWHSTCYFLLDKLRRMYDSDMILSIISAKSDQAKKMFELTRQAYYFYYLTKINRAYVFLNSRSQLLFKFDKLISSMDYYSTQCNSLELMNIYEFERCLKLKRRELKLVLSYLSQHFEATFGWKIELEKYNSSSHKSIICHFPTTMTYTCVGKWKIE